MVTSFTFWYKINGVRFLTSVIWNKLYIIYGDKIVNKWFLSAELFSLIIILILMLNFYERRWRGFPQRKTYQLCLLTSGGSILLNILCVYTIYYAWELPLWVNLLCNSLYFLLIVAVSTIVAYYLLRLLFHHIYQQRRQRIFTGILFVLYLFYFALILYNLHSGILFYFNEDRVYCRGPLINVGYGIMGIQLLMLVYVTLRYRKSVSLPMRRVMRILPPIILLLTVYQLLYPDVLFNGGIIVAANIILMVNFQSRRIEQDTLTSSGSRNSFHQELTLRLGGHQHFQVIIISIHKFGSINHRYGHEKGDHLLYEIALWLERLHRSGNSYRVGNVDFTLLVPYTGMVSSRKLLDTICQRFSQPWDVDGTSVILDTTFADLICTDQDWDATDIMEFLDFSLSLAKDRPDRTVRFDEAVYRRMEQRNQIIKRMQQAVRENLFQVWYQPIYHCATGKFAMAEALVRMMDSEGNLISPSIFIPLAEQHGLINEIGSITLLNAGRLLENTDPEQLKVVSVNLSMQQFMSADLVSDLQALTERFHFDPSRLKLELTERVLSEDIPRMKQMMTELQQMGFLFSLDDFGIGYSNLSTVLDYSFSSIKLDKSLIQGYSDNKQSAFIVNAMLDLFHHMGCQVVAEGVETEAQAQALISRGADWIQGFYYAKPMPEAEFLQFLRDQNAASPEN